MQPYNPYSRVIPRDLFNEAKLLKGLGILILAIHNEDAPEGLDFEQPPEGEPFNVVQDPASGDLYCTNVTVTLDGDELDLFHPYNEREGLTLRYEDEDRYAFGHVFKQDGSGDFSESFVNYCTLVTNE